MQTDISLKGLIVIAVLVLAGCAPPGTEEPKDDYSNAYNGTIRSDKTQIDFQMQYGIPPQPQQIITTFDGSGGSYEVPFEASSWLTVIPTSSEEGSRTYSIEVKESLDPGTHSATLKFSTWVDGAVIVEADGGRRTPEPVTISVPVSVTVADGVVFRYDSYEKSYHWGQYEPMVCCFVMSSHAQQWSAEVDVPWLTLDKYSGQGSHSFSVKFNKTEWPVGASVAHITVRADNGQNSVLTIHLNVIEPVVATTPDTLRVLGNVGPAKPEQFKIELKELATGYPQTISDAGARRPFLVRSTESLQVWPERGLVGDPITVSYRALPQSRASGIYSEELAVEVDVPGKKLVHKVPIQLQVEPHRLYVPSNGLALTYGPGYDKRSANFDVIDSANDTSANITVSSDQNWLSISRDGTKVTVTANADGLSDGLHIATVAIHANGNSTAAGETVNVGFYVFSNTPVSGNTGYAAANRYLTSDPVRPWIYLAEGNAINAIDTYTGLVAKSFVMPAMVLDAVPSRDGMYLYTMLDDSTRTIRAIHIGTSTLTPTAYVSNSQSNQLSFLRAQGIPVLMTDSGVIVHADTGTSIELHDAHPDWWTKPEARAYLGPVFYHTNRFYMVESDRSYSRYEFRYSSVSKSELTNIEPGGRWVSELPPRFLMSPSDRYICVNSFCEDYQNGDSPTPYIAPYFHLPSFVYRWTNDALILNDDETLYGSTETGLALYRPGTLYEDVQILLRQIATDPGAVTLVRSSDGLRLATLNQLDQSGNKTLHVYSATH